VKNSKTLPKIRGTALVILNKVGGNPVSYNICVMALPQVGVDRVKPKIIT